MMQGYVVRKGQQWYAVVYAGLDPVTGRERRRWHAAGTDRPTAERLARQLARAEQLRRGDGRGRLTFAGFSARHWLPAKQMQLRPTTMESYQRMLRLHILPTLGSVPLGQVSADMLHNLYGRLLLDGRHDGTGGLSAKTVHEVHAVVRNILDDAVHRGLLAVNAAHLASSPRFRRDHHRRRKAWTAQELRCFIDSVAGQRSHRWFWLAAYTGMRRGELVGLRWRDIEFEHARLTIVRTVICVGARMQEAGGKTPNAARTIDLDLATVQLLADWRAEQAAHFGADDANRWVFTKPDGDLLHPQSLSQAFDRAVATAAVPKISLHGLRHTHATLLLKAGVPLKVVSERLGHATPAFTMATYQHILPGMQAEAAATFAALLEPTSTGGPPVEEPVEAPGQPLPPGRPNALKPLVNRGFSRVARTGFEPVTSGL